jgi:hypothetical protein
MIEAFKWIKEKHCGHRISTAGSEGASVVWCEDCDTGAAFGDPRRTQEAWDKLDAAYRLAEKVRAEGRG